MTIDNQIEPPQSFMAMYITQGQSRPTAPQEMVLGRYEQCEDMACVLTEHAQTLAFKENFSAPEILSRCRKDLLDHESDFNDKEAEWIICRLAELLGWEPPTFK
ncbi:MAG: ATPase with chaperone activity [Rhodocyclaceae bacterium]|nr:ATPase with chaperone activity [Rhodocyclaceae bacterium]